jgi:hypothetical protein
MQPFDYHSLKFQQDFENEVSFRRKLSWNLNFVIGREAYDNVCYLRNRNDFHNLAVKQELAELELSGLDVVDVGGQVGQLSAYIPDARSYRSIERYNYPNLTAHFKDKINAKVVHDDFCSHIENHPELFQSTTNLFIFSMVLNEFSVSESIFVINKIMSLNPDNKVLIIESDRTAWKIRNCMSDYVFNQAIESFGVIDLSDSRPLQEINGHYLQRRFRYIAFKINFGEKEWNF